MGTSPLSHSQLSLVFADESMAPTLLAPTTHPVTVIKLVPQSLSVEEMAEQVTSAILRLFEQGKSASVSFSGGKDSSALMHLTLVAASRAKAGGLDPMVVVFSSDTGVENPEVALLLRKEHRKIAATLKAQGIRHEIHLTQPSLNSSWAVRILGGIKLPSFPGGAHECAVDWKVNPIRAARNQVFAELGKSNTVTLIGTRFSESVERARAMTERGELAEVPYLNEIGELVMSPIAFWSTDDVWELIGLVRAGAVESYSDFEDTFRLYADAGGTSCAVVSDAITEGLKKARKGCGARFGCHSCQAVAADASLDTMIASDPSYAYMAGLNKLRTLISKTRFDYSKRYWVQRTLDDQGQVKLQPDCYSPAFVLELFRYCATLDYDERRAARKLKMAPRFELLNWESVVAIDALWSLHGFHRPHTALFEWLAISEGREHYPLPDVNALQETPRTPVPKAVPYLVGAQWDGDRYDLFSGHRDTSSTFAECRTTRDHKDGRTVLELDTEIKMAVDVESVVMALDFEMDGFLERHRAASEHDDWTSGYRFWLNYGTLTLGHAQALDHDLALRRTNWRFRNGFRGEEGNRYAQALAQASMAQTATTSPAGSSEDFGLEMQ